MANLNIVDEGVAGSVEVQNESGSAKLQSSQLENRIGHTALLVGRTTLFIFGGQISTGGTSTLLTNSMTAYDVERNEWWSIATSGPMPCPRRGHSAVLVGDSMYVFGGCGANSEPLNDLWKFTFMADLSGKSCGSWHQIITISGSTSNPAHPSSPSPRFFHACEVIDTTMYVFGGQDGSRDLGDFYALNLKNLRWSSVELSGETTIKPGSKSGARLMSFESKLLLLGGSQPLDDYALDIYVFYPKKAAWYLQRYDMENDEPKVDTGGSSPPPAAVPPLLGSGAHSRNTYHGDSSDVLLSNRYSRIESSPSIMTVDKRNRIFHSVALIKSRIGTDSVPSTPSSPQIVSPRGGGSSPSSASAPSPTPPHQCQLFIFGGVNQMLANVLDQVTLEFSDLSDLFASLSSTGGFYFGDPGSSASTSSSSLLSTYSKDDEDLFLNLPKEDWEAAALYYNPEVLALSERVRMLTGEPSYAKTAENSGRTQALSTLSSRDVLGLLMEWLAQNGYRSTIQRLERDTRQSFIRGHDTKSAALESLVSFAKRRIKRGTSIWDDHILAIVASGGQTLQNTVEPLTSGLLTQPSIVSPVVQCIDHLPDWYHSQSKEIIMSQNPWDEALVLDDNLKLEVVPTTGQPKIMFASVNALVILTLDYTNFVNEDAVVEEIDDFISAFFHSYHSFATPIILLEKYIQLFEVPESTSVPEDAISAHRRKIIEMLLVWIDLASWDWSNEYLTQKLKDFADGPLVNTDLRWMAPQIKSALSIALDFSNSPASSHAAADSASGSLYPHIGGGLNLSANHLANVGKVKSHAITTRQLMSMAPLPGTQRMRMGIMEQLDEPPEPVVRKTIFSAQHTLDDVPEIEVARQLTIIQFSLFCMIKPSEFLNGWWKSEDAEYRSPHLRVCLNRASVVSDWVVQSISRPGDDRKARGKAVERFFKIAIELRSLQNFETLSQILQGLKHAPEDLLERIDRKHLETLYKLDTSISGHNEAVDALDADIVPCVPNLKLVLKQISKIEDEAQLLVVQPTKLGRPLVNMHKCRSLHNILRKLLSLQSRFYNLLPVYQIISPLRNPLGSSTEAAATASLRIMLQPRLQ